MRSCCWLCLACVVCAAACSQKDPGKARDSAMDDDKDAGDTTAESVAKDYYPMVAGSTLTYRHSGNVSPWDDKTVVSDSPDWQGNQAYLTEGAPDPKGETGENTIIRVGSKLLRAHKKELKADVVQGTVDYDPGFLRFDAAWAKVEDGHAEQVKYNRVEKTAAGSVISDDDREHTFTVEKLHDSVTVPAGKFDDCMRVRRERIRGNPAKSADDDDKVFWFCPGIGKVRELSEIGGGTEELVGCKIPGGLCP
jgi:hypothetical protein